MRHPHLRFNPAPLTLAIALAISAPGLVHAQAATADKPVAISIAAQPLDAALNELAAATGVPVAFSPALVAGKKAPAVKGNLTPREAVNQLLSGSGLVATQEGGSMVIKAVRSPGDQGAMLPVVTVKAAAELETATSPVQGYVAKRSATGTKTDTPIIETPQSISVLGAREIEAKGAVTLVDALAQTAGVQASSWGFDLRDQDWIGLRGFDAWNTSSFRDGLPQTVGITFLGVPTEVYGLERIEVLRGPTSVLFGKGDAGGIVNRVSKVANAGVTREIGVQVGNHGRKQVAADIGGALDEAGELNWRLVGLTLDTNSQEKYPDGTDTYRKRQYLAPSLRWRPSARTSLVVQAEVLRDDASDDVGYIETADGRPTRLKEGDPKFSRIRTDSDAIGWQLEHAFDSGWTLHHKLRYAKRDMDKHHIVSWYDDSTTLARQARHDVESVDEIAVDTSIQRTFAADIATHTLLAGVDWDDAHADWRRWRDMTSSLDVTNPVYGVAIAEPTTPAANTVVTSRQLGLYVQDQMKFGPHWGLTVGARHDRVRTVNDDRFNTSRTTQTDHATTGRIGLNYLLGNGWAPYVSWATAFVPNLGVDGNGQAFEPSRSRQFELGAKYIPDNAPVSFTAALFDLEKDNVVSYDPSTWEPRQIGRVRSRGVELEAKADLSRRLRITAAYTRLDVEVLASADTGEVGKTPILIPQQSASLWLDQALSGDVDRGLVASLGLRHTGKRWNDTSNTSSESPVTVVDAAVRYDNGPWRMALNVTNLFNKRYLASRAWDSYHDAPRRGILLSAKYRF